MNRHPLHPALVHFPIACWSLGTLLDVASPWWPPAVEMGSLLLLAGLLIAFPVMLAGLWDSRRVAGPAEKTLYRHMGFVLLAWLAYALSLVLRWQDGSFLPARGLPLALSLGGWASLVAAGWCGGQLVYGFGTGVNPSPER